MFHPGSISLDVPLGPCGICPSSKLRLENELAWQTAKVTTLAAKTMLRECVRILGEVI
jgi:hypothetical protein